MARFANGNANFIEPRLLSLGFWVTGAKLLENSLLCIFKDFSLFYILFLIQYFVKYLSMEIQIILNPVFISFEILGNWGKFAQNLIVVHNYDYYD